MRRVALVRHPEKTNVQIDNTIYEIFENIINYFALSFTTILLCETAFVLFLKRAWASAACGPAKAAHAPPSTPIHTTITKARTQRRFSLA